MALSSGNSHTPRGGEIRDPEAEGLASIKSRIAEYKANDLDTEFLEKEAEALTNKRKGNRNSDEADRDDSTDGAAELEKIRKAKASSRLENKANKDTKVWGDRATTPDSAPSAQSSIPDQVGEPAERVQGPQKKTSVPDQGPKREDSPDPDNSAKTFPTTSAAEVEKDKSAESDNKEPSKAATKVEKK